MAGVNANRDPLGDMEALLESWAPAMSAQDSEAQTYQRAQPADAEKQAYYNPELIRQTLTVYNMINNQLNARENYIAQEHNNMAQYKKQRPKGPYKTRKQIRKQPVRPGLLSAKFRRRRYSENPWVNHIMRKTLIRQRNSNE